MLHAGEIPRKEDVSVANIKQKKDLKKINSLKQQVCSNGMARNNGEGVGCRCLVTKAQNVQECIFCFFNRLVPHLLMTRHLVLQHNLHFYKL